MTSTSRYLYLPPEILHKIIDHLAEDDFVGGTQSGKRDLQQCSLVCTFFAQRSRQHIFRHINGHFTFGDDNKILQSKRVLANLVDILDPCSPLGGIASFVQEFSLSLLFSTDLFPQLQTHYLCRIFDMLYAETYGVKYFKLVFPGLTGVYWSALEPLTQASIYRLAHSPRLEALHITALLDVPPDLITSPQIDRLSINQVCLIDHFYSFLPCPHPFNNATCFSNISSLDTDFTFPFRKFLSSTADSHLPTYPFKNLKRLRSTNFTRVRDGPMCVQKLLQRSPHLDTISLCGNSFDSIRDPWDLTACPKLTWFALSITKSRGARPHCVSTALKLLNHPHPHPSLTTLILGVSIVDYDAELLNLPPNHTWKQLNDMLARGRFPNLKLFRVKLYDEVDWSVMRRPGFVPFRAPGLKDAAEALIRGSLTWVGQQQGLVFQLELDCRHSGMVDALVSP